MSLRPHRPTLEGLLWRVEHRSGAWLALLVVKQALTMLMQHGVFAPNAAVRNAMPYSLADAAKATGTNKTTILRAIKSGKISGAKDEHGAWLVEPAELHRVYPLAELRSGAGSDATQQYAPPSAAVIEGQIAALRDTAELLRAQLDDVRKDRDSWRDQAQAITRQLADARTPQPAARPWWRRLAG